MKIVIDSNIFCQDYRLKGAHFCLFFDGLRSIAGQLIVPEVVVDEVVNRFREDIDSHYCKFIIEERQIAHMLDDSRFKLRSVLDQEIEVNKYRSAFISKIESNGGKILPYPFIDHKEVVKRDLQRRKPFKPDGSGYRDFLIWESIKKLISEDDVAFITNNKKDFGEGPEIDATFHAEILDPSRITIYKNLKDFNEKKILPMRTMLDEFASALKSNNVKEFDILLWLYDYLFDLIKQYDIKTIVTGFPKTVGEVKIHSLKSYDNLEVIRADEMETGEKYVSIHVMISVECSVHINNIKDELKIYEVQHWVSLHKDNSYGLFNPIIVPLWVTVTFILDVQNAMLKSATIGPIDGEYGSIDEDGTIYIFDHSS